MQTSYRELFSINIWHSYYRDGICDCLRIQPTQTTRLLLECFGFKIRNMVNRLIVYTITQQPVSSLLNYISKATSTTFFQFNLISTNTYFILYTQLPIDWVGQLLYTTQLMTNTKGTDAYELATVLSGTNAHEYSGTVKLNLEDLQHLLSVTPKIELNIRLESRRTFWRYYFINTTAFSTGELSVTNTNNISFNKVENVILENGETAVVFTSQVPVPLRQKPDHHFNLTCSVRSGNRVSERIVYKGLPGPDPVYFTVSVLQIEQQIFSPIYVYL